MIGDTDAGIEGETEGRRDLDLKNTSDHLGGLWVLESSSSLADSVACRVVLNRGSTARGRGSLGETEEEKNAAEMVST